MTFKQRTLTLAISLAFSAVSTLAQAQTVLTVKEIKVEGAQRTDVGTIFNYLPIKIGDKPDAEAISAAIKALYATGFFRDVRLEASGDTLVVQVVERPTVSNVSIAGAKDIEPEQLKKALRENNLAEGRIFDRSILEKAEQELKRQYISKGRYGVEITTTVTPLERNRVAVTISVNEGEVAQIKRINIVGAKAFRESDIIDEMQITTPGWFTWYTKTDQYSRQKLQGDLESLRNYYTNRGYLEFNVESTQVSISPDKESIDITININEGNRFTVSDVKLAGDMIIPEADVRRRILVRPGEVFNRQYLTESAKYISDRLGEEGYAFANVNAIPEIDKEKRTVSFTFFIDPGRRTYVRRINVSGNAKTRDEVIRRELR
ncbi:MAG: outer membrane protein assembly factor BamA, partial [Pseudomonadota bacterium]